jgi:hypothetical protein
MLLQSLGELLPENFSAHFVSEMINTLYLSAF